MYEIANITIQNTNDIKWQLDRSELSSNCERYAQPSLCYSTFPICREFPKTQKLSTQLFNLLNSNQQETFEETDGGEDTLDDLSRLRHGMPRKKRGAKFRSSIDSALESNKERIGECLQNRNSRGTFKKFISRDLLECSRGAGMMMTRDENQKKNRYF